MILDMIWCWLYFVVWFFAVARWEHMKDDGTWETVPAAFRYSLLAGLIPGLILDVIFNATYGTLHFRELPNEWVFTERVKNTLREREPGDRRHDLALWWKEVLNTIDPGHV